MPERFDRVTVHTPRRSVVIPWASRDRLLARLRKIDRAGAIVAGFEAVGATRPVVLTSGQQDILEEVIDKWISETGADDLPEGIYQLRHHIIDDDAVAD